MSLFKIIRFFTIVPFCFGLYVSAMQPAKTTFQIQLDSEKREYQCLLCNQIVTIKNKSRHINSHKKPFSCGYCDYVAQSGSAICNHAAKKHPEKEEGYFRKGMWITNDAEIINKQKDAQLKVDRKPFNSTVQEIFAASNIPVVTFSKHNQKPTTFLCKSCGNAFTSVESFKDHKSRCPKTYTQKINKRIAKKKLPSLWRNAIMQKLLTQQKLHSVSKQESNPAQKLFVEQIAEAHGTLLANIVQASNHYAMSIESSNSQGIRL